MSIEGDMKASAQSVHQRLMKPAPPMPKTPTVIRRTVMVDRRKPPEALPFAHIETPPLKPRMRKLDLDRIFDEDVEDGREWRLSVKAILVRHAETLKRLRSNNRDQHIVECRRDVAKYLRTRGWSFSRIGEFVDRDHSSVCNLLNPKNQIPT